MQKTLKTNLFDMNSFKRPESVLVIITAESSGNVLMLRRKDDPDFWQSVTGSLEDHEGAFETAMREVREETGFLPKRGNCMTWRVKSLLKFLRISGIVMLPV